MRKASWFVAAMVVLASWSSPQAASALPVPVKIAINGQPAFSNIAAIYAVKEGLLAKRGYAAELVVVPNDTTGIQGLVSRSFEIVTQGVSSSITAAARGAPLVLVDSICPLVDYQFVARPEINTVKQLDGKSVGISSPGSIADQVTRAILVKQGVDVSKVQIVGVGADPDRVKAVAAGKIDGAVVNTLQTLIALKADAKIHILLDVGKELAAEFLLTGVVTTKDIATKQPKIVQDVVASFIEASRILRTKDAFVAYAVKQEMPADSVGETFDLLNKSSPYLPVNGGLTQSAFDATVQAMYAAGQIEKRISYADMANTKFLEAALKELGPSTK
jgi:NitT/TauT family transport system substrate-binding protein